jgi:hypothetical protein
MRRFFNKSGLLSVVICIAVLSAASAVARVAETEQTNRMLYGAPVKTEEVRGYDKRVTYKTPLYHISILYRNGLAQVVSYTLAEDGEGLYRLKGKSKLSIRRLVILLRKSNIPADSAGGRNVWYFDDQSTGDGLIGFIDADKRTAADYDLKTDTLTVRLLQQRPAVR